MKNGTRKSQSLRVPSLMCVRSCVRIGPDPVRDGIEGTLRHADVHHALGSGPIHEVQGNDLPRLDRVEDATEVLG